MMSVAFKNRMVVVLILIGNIIWLLGVFFVTVRFHQLFVSTITKTIKTDSLFQKEIRTQA